MRRFVPGLFLLVAFVTLIFSGCGGRTDEDATRAAMVISSLKFDSASVEDSLIIGRIPSRAQVRRMASPAKALDADALMAWAESVLPAVFPGPQTTARASAGAIDYVYRFYPLPSGGWNMIAVTVADSKVYLLGDITAGSLKQFGTLADYACVVHVCPLRVYPTSYENKNAIPFDATQVPLVRPGIPKAYADELNSEGRSVTFGDFFQEGRYSAFVMARRAGNLYGVPDISDLPGVAYFLAMDANGNWIDRTSELLKTPADRVVCVTASYSITADFNNDGKPDVYVACNGVDYGLNIPDPQEWRRVFLSNQVVFLSQPDGSYKRIDVPFQLYGHKAEAADINGDGNVDILTTNQVDGSERMPFVLLGNGNGTFVRDDAIVPGNVFNLTDPTQNAALSNGIYNVFLIPIDNRLDVIFGGERNTIWIKGNGRGGFDASSVVTFAIPASQAKGVKYQFPLDVVYADGNFYFHTTAINQAGAEWATLKFSTTGALQGILHIFDNPTAQYQSAQEQFKPTNDGYLVAYGGGCLVNGSELAIFNGTGNCYLRIKR